jgi:hypothetical protein
MAVELPPTVSNTNLARMPSENTGQNCLNRLVHDSYFASDVKFGLIVRIA